MKITNVQQVSYPDCRFIGKKYGDAERTNGGFGPKWGEWFQNGWFNQLENLGSLEEAGDAYIGLMNDVGAFAYWIGMFFPAGKDVPDGFAYVDIPATKYGVCWLFGNEQTGELYGMDAHKRSSDAIREKGMVGKQNGYAFELYNCPRFTTPDEHGNVILDYGIEVE